MKPGELYDSIVDVVTKNDLGDNLVLSDIRSQIIRAVVDPNKTYSKHMHLELPGSRKIVTDVWRCRATKLVDHYIEPGKFLRVLSVPYVLRADTGWELQEGVLDTHTVSIGYVESASSFVGKNKVNIKESSQGFVASYIVNPQMFAMLKQFYSMGAEEYAVLEHTLRQDWEAVSAPYRLNLESQKAFDPKQFAKFHPFSNDLTSDAARPFTEAEAGIYLVEREDVILETVRCDTPTDEVRKFNIADFARPDSKPTLKN